MTQFNQLHAAQAEGDENEMAEAPIGHDAAAKGRGRDRGFGVVNGVDAMTASADAVGAKGGGFDGGDFEGGRLGERESCQEKGGG
jgi:hypothetical protein